MRSLTQLKSNLLSLVCVYRHQTVRYYRFGNRVRNRGFYYSPNYELNKQFIRNDLEIIEPKLSSEELRLKRNKLFDDEKRRQSDLVTRVEKISVSVLNPFGSDEKQSIDLFMNRWMSTPYDCSQHIHRLISDRSVLALIDDKTYWDINRPLVSDCSLRFQHFKQSNPHFLNKTFWRSCSLMMGSVIEKAFKDDIQVLLHSWPKPDPNSGSFLYDVCIQSDNWCPNAEELRVFTAMLQKMSSQDIPFERLEVKKDLAKELFEYNTIKRQQMDSIAESNGSEDVTLYRIKDHIDMSCGPMIANTSQVGAIHVTAVHRMPSVVGLGPIYRFQGIAIPKQLNINSFTFSILRERAQKLNSSKFLDHFSAQTVREVSEVNENHLNNESEIDAKVDKNVN